SARNWQEVSVYVVTAQGAYRYDAQANLLRAEVAADLRAATGKQSFVGDAPLNLVYVADLTRMEGASPDDALLYAYADTGFISQNVYLFCAAEGLATVVRGLVDRERLAEALGLAPQERVILAQTIGHPAAEESD
ncbi:MAG: SagB/ThcOx family dehydrogenase, partial [Candidatus Eisenbacteria bacterium]|nr:SagB/ThcOx family dehydrogenase [Candidatus Eisenbacteria bacterium]